MTTATLTAGNRTMETVVRPRRSLEELVDRLMAAMFPARPMAAAETSVIRSVHEARRLRQAGDIDGALAVLGGVDTAQATTREARWAYAEWTQLVKRRFGNRDPVLYSQGTGRAAALVPNGDGTTLEVVAVLGMRWRPGKVVSTRSLRGLQPPYQVRGRLWGRLAHDPGLGTLPGDVGGAADLATLARTRRLLALGRTGRVRR